MKTRVLVVEDDDDNRALLGELLEERFDVRLAADGTEGLEAFRQTRPDVVVTDQSLPGMDGTSLAREIKATTPRTGVVLLSGHPRIEGTEACDVVLSKPVDFDKLTRAIDAASARGASA